ncbi:hypothetical protein L218DRAFT_996592 [Marasmius fiardii PR-910]|nr:hypothetical protein L218DRAFT_996592 [Marasmius fiardii PR-910]
MFCWDVFVTGIAIRGNSPTPTPSTGAHTLVGCTIAAMVQSFFAWRIYSLRRESVVVKLIAMVIILAVSGVVGVGLVRFSGDLQIFDQKLFELTFLDSTFEQVNMWRVAWRFSAAYRYFLGQVEIWLIGAVVCDLIIAVAMTWILTRYRRASTVRSTQSLIKSLILRSVETGIVTFIFTLINLVLFTLYTDNYLDRTLSKLYSNALLLSLNARGKAMSEPTADYDTSGSSVRNGFRLSAMSGSNRFTTISSSFGDPSEIHIATHTETGARFDNRAELLCKIKDAGPFKAPNRVIASV